MTAPIDLVLGKLVGVKKNGKGFTARCPAHADERASLHVTACQDGRALLHCFAGCPPESIVDTLGLTFKDLFPTSEGGGGSKTPSDTGATAQPPGVTLERYAEYKQLPEQFLVGLGLSTAHPYGKMPVVRIPYGTTDGQPGPRRFRTALDKSPDSDNRFRWASGTKPTLYGLDRLEAIRKAGYVVLVEGESDCHTLWYHDIPALGLPGANLWKEEWAKHLDDVPTIHVVIEPDTGGAAVRKWLATSAIRDRVQLVELGEYKDPSRLYLADRDGFRANWDAAVAAATPWSDLVSAEA